MSEIETQNGFNKNMAKKTGKTSPTNANSNGKNFSVSVKNIGSAAPDSKKFLNDYQKTLLRNQQIDWLNGKNDAFVSEKQPKVEEPKVSNAQMPAFWKKSEGHTQNVQNTVKTESNPDKEYQQKLNKARCSFIQKSKVGDNPSNPNDDSTHTPSTNSQGQAANQVGVKVFSSNNSPLVQAGLSKPKNEIIDLTRPQKQESQMFAIFKNNKNSNVQLGTNVPNIINNSFKNNQNNTPVLPSNTINNHHIFNKVNTPQFSPPRVPTFPNQPFNSNSLQQISIRPTVAFNNNSQNNNFSNSNSSPNPTNVNFLNNGPQFMPQNQVKTNNINMNVDLSKAGFKKESWVCALPYQQNKSWLQHRSQLASNLKNHSNVDQKMLDMLAVITFSQHKTMPLAQIEEKRVTIKTLALSFEQAKQNQSDLIVNQANTMKDRQIAVFSLSKYIPVYERLTPKTIKYNSEEEVLQLLKDEKILEHYKKIQNETVQYFLQSYQDFYQASYDQFQQLTAMTIQLVEGRKEIEAQLCQFGQSKQKGHMSNIFSDIEERQQDIVNFLKKLVDRLRCRIEDLPKSDLCYELQAIAHLQHQQRLLLAEILSCNKQLEQAKSGQPYKSMTDILCHCTSYLASRVKEIESTMKKAFPQ